MEKSIKLIRFPLKITGFDVFSDSRTFGHTICHWIFYITIANLIFCFFHTMFTNENLEFVDLILLSTSTSVYISISIQSYLFWAGKDKIVVVTKIINGFHAYREDDWVNIHSLPLFQKCGRNCYIMAKSVIIGTCLLAILPTTPLIIPGVDLMYPMEINYIPNRSINYYINLGAQIMAFDLYLINHFIMLIIFFVFNTNILFELKLIAKLCGKIGNSAFLVEVCQIMKDDNKNKHPKILKTIVKYHTNVLLVCNIVNDIYSHILLFYEGIFVVSSAALYILLLFDVGRALAFMPLLTIVFVEYFLVSYISALIKENFENVGHSLYMSRWYLLDVQEKQNVCKILMMAQKQKTMEIGVFGFSNLERFSAATKFVYQISLLMKNLVNQAN